MNILISKRGGKKYCILVNILIWTGKVILLTALLLLTSRQIFGIVMRCNHHIKSPGIDVSETVNIGGIDQCLYIRGKNVENPVILFLHGGPGTPQMPLLYTFQYKWEDNFTIAHWDQRAAGNTYFANDPEEIIPTISFEQAVKDARELTRYLQKRFNKKKIIILGYSWGSVLGAKLVQTYPEDYSAYIGVGQIVDGIEGEKIAFKKVLDMAKLKNNSNDIKKLENLKPYPAAKFDCNKLAEVRKMQVKYDLAVGVEKRSIVGYFFSPYISLKELTYYLHDPFEMNKEIIQYVFHDYKIRDYGMEYSVPVIYIQGENDYQTPTKLVQDYFEKVEAPYKKIFIIKDAGHAPMMDNPKEFSDILTNAVLPTIEK